MADDTHWRGPQPVRIILRLNREPRLPAMTMLKNPRRDRYWLLAALLFGLLVLPFLVHLTGLYVLGGYAGGGSLSFMADFLVGLVTLRWYSWVLALGPLAIVACWLIVGRFARRSNG
jgi:hypothetical protein